MSKYNIGDVVLALFPFSDGITAKKRPAVVIDIRENQDYIICKITHFNKTDITEGYWIKQNSDLGKEMGILQDSFLAVNDTAIIQEKFLFKKIGECKVVRSQP